MLSHPEAKHRRKFEWLVISLIILFRFYIAGHDEISVLLNDSTNYARHAVYAFQPGGYSMIPPQSPGISMLAISAAEFGIPYKIFLDASLIIVAIFAWRLVHQLTQSSVCSLSTFAIIALNPWFFRSATVFMSEAPTAILLLAMVLSGIHLLKSPTHLGTLVMASAISTLYMLTRSEFPLLLAFWLTIGGLIFLFGEKNPERPSRKAKLARSSLILIPLVVSLGGVQVMKSIHLRCYGVAALTATEASGVKDLMNALYGIAPETEIRYAPVTLQSLTKACEECPTLNEHRNRLLDLKAPAFSSARRNLKLENEFGTWLNWHLVRAFRGVSKKSNEQMHQAAKEIRIAQSENRLGSRSGRFPMDPLWRQWLSDLPMSWLSMVRVSASPRLLTQVGTTRFAHRRLQDEVIQGFFDEGLLRRNGIGYETTLRVSGSCPKSGYRRAKIFAASKELIGEVLVENKNNKSQFGFSTRGFKIKERYPIRVLLYHHEDEGVSNSAVRLDRNEGNQRFVAKLDELRQENWVISISTSEPNSQRNLIRSTVIRNSLPATLSLFGLCFLIGAVRGVAKGKLKLIVVAIVAGLVFLLVRCLFYSLVDVWLNWSAHRYVEPNSLFTHLIFLLICFSIGATLNRKIGFLGANRFSHFQNEPTDVETTSTASTTT